MDDNALIKKPKRHRWQKTKALGLTAGDAGSTFSQGILPFANLAGANLT